MALDVARRDSATQGKDLNHSRRGQAGHDPAWWGATERDNATQGLFFTFLKGDWHENGGHYFGVY
jgi:hypothetical protein